MDFINNFELALDRAGIPSSQAVRSDGQFHRYHVKGDTKNRKNGWYRLTVEGDIAWGVFGCNKRGISEKWWSKDKKEFTPNDRARVEAKQKKIREDEEIGYQRTAEKARRIWDRAHEIETHPYAERKGIELHGVRGYKDKLIVPMYFKAPEDEKPAIVGLQFIGEDGSKLFLTGQRKKGCYTSITKTGDSKEILWICEGYATGASIYEAIGQPVIVAFDAGNLSPVANYIRSKFPQATIIFAADNDQWTKKQTGEAYNPGIEAATSAAGSFGGRLVYPPFDKTDPRKPTDFNDLHMIAGLDMVREALIGNPIEIPPPDQPKSEENGGMPVDNEQASLRDNKPTTTPDPALNLPMVANWKQMLIMGKYTNDETFPHSYDSKSKMNAYLFMKYGAMMKDVFVYNEFSDEVLLMTCPPWENESQFMPRPMKTEDSYMIAAHLEREGIKVGQDSTTACAIKIAGENKINPPRDYFEGLKWDGKPRLDHWLTYYVGAEEQPEKYLSLVGSKWMIGAVSRVFEPGVKFDSMMILEGKQDAGKSTVLRLLATFNGENYFLDSVGDIRNKDTIMTMQGKIIIEMAELASFKKTENEEIKGFITRQVDEYRPPYGRHIQKRPRYFVLAATTNEIDEGYLTDETGNRRYWPVKCGAIDLEALGRDKEQLWAEAVYRYKAGERTWLTRDEVIFSTAEQKKRQIEDAWHDDIAGLDYVRYGHETKIARIMESLDLKPRDMNNMMKKRIKNSLKLLGWYETKRAGDGRIWRKKPVENNS